MDFLFSLLVLLGFALGQLERLFLDDSLPLSFGRFEGLIEWQR